MLARAHAQILRSFIQQPDAQTTVLKVRALPEELAESLVVGDGSVVVLREAVLDVFKAPLLHQLAGGFGLLGKSRHNQ